MTVQFMEEDVEARSLERIMCLNTGVQRYLNTCFKADKLVTKYTELLHRVGNSSTSAPTAEIVDLRKACIDINHRILSGDAGRTALSDYCEFFVNVDGDCWAGWRMDNDEKFGVCCDMLCIMQDIAYRLIFKLDTSKINLFDVALIDDQAADDYDIDAVRAIATTLRQQKSMSLGDAIIAATALHYQQPIVTANVQDFKSLVGIQLINPLESNS